MSAIQLVTWNAGMYGFRDRAKLTTKIFGELEDVSVFLLQEITEENLPCFQQHGLKFVRSAGMATRMEGRDFTSHNIVAYKPDEFTVRSSGTVWLTPGGYPGKGPWQDANAERNAVYAVLFDRVTNQERLFISAQFDNVSHDARSFSMKRILQFKERMIVTRKIERVVFGGDLNLTVGPINNWWPIEKQAVYYQAIMGGGLKDAWYSHPLRSHEQTFNGFQTGTPGTDPYHLVNPDHVFTAGYETVTANTIKAEGPGICATDHNPLRIWLKDKKMGAYTGRKKMHIWLDED